MQVSVIIPTYGRPESLARLLEGLSRQTFPAGNFEVIVVVDGSSPSLERLLEGAGCPFPLRWYVRPHRGETAVRNFGITQATGEILVYLDDDILPVPELLARHYACHTQDPRLVVLGAIAVDPDSPEKFLGETTDFASRVFRRCTTPGYQPTHLDFLDGNFSVRKRHLVEIGGWDEALRGYGGLDDLELGYRMKQLGLRFRFEPQALGYHYYVKTLARLLEDNRTVGRAQIYYFSKHPDRLCDLRLPAALAGSKRKQFALHLAKVAPELMFTFLKNGFAAHLRSMRPRRGVKLAGAMVRFLQGLFLYRGYWEGPVPLEGIRRQLNLRIPILAYQRVSSDAGAERGLTVAVGNFSRQMALLARRGYQSVSLDDFRQWQTSLRPLPPHPVILTFDGGCREIREHVAPILKGHRFRATIFVRAHKAAESVAGDGQGDPAIMEPEAIKELARMGFDIGVEGLTHSDWTQVSVDIVRRELSESRRIIEQIVGQPPRFVAYPGGRWTSAIRNLIEASGFWGACTQDSGLNGFHQDRFLLKRNLILPGTRSSRLGRLLRRGG